MSSTTTLTAADILSIPLAELRERVDLAERLSIAARHGGASSSSAATPSAGSATKPQAAAVVKPTPAPAAKPTPAAAAVVENDDPLGDFTSGGDAGGDALGDFGGGADDDLMSGFVEEVSPADARTKASEVAKIVIGRKVTSELDIARGILKKYGVNKIGEVGDDKIVALWNDLKEAFPADAS